QMFILLTLFALLFVSSSVGTSRNIHKRQIMFNNPWIPGPFGFGPNPYFGGAAQGGVPFFGGFVPSPPPNAVVHYHPIATSAGGQKINGYTWSWSSQP
ncbi:hypothetical protein PMAYCL1PPCAC_29924, partial [Pristionchus mayeri]